jgi:hypothetical protein
MSYGPAPNLAGGLWLSSDSGDDSGGATCGPPDDPGGGDVPPIGPPTPPPPTMPPAPPRRPPGPVPDPIVPPKPPRPIRPIRPIQPPPHGGGGHCPPCIHPITCIGWRPALPPAMPFGLQPLPTMPGTGWIICFPGSGWIVPPGAGCCRIPYGVTPASVPGPGAPYRFILSAAEGGFGGAKVSGLMVTCKETGVTQATTCGNVDFNFTASGGPATFTSQAGYALNCNDNHTYHYAADTESNTVQPLPTFISLSVTRN